MTVATTQDLNGGNNNNVGIKVSFGREIRRASMKGESASSFSHLCELVAELFSLEKENLALKYKDEDGDLITISLDKEVNEAVQLAQANKSPLHLVVEVNVKAEPAPKNVTVKAEPGLTQDPSVAFSTLALNHSSSPLPLPLPLPLSSPIPPSPSSLAPAPVSPSSTTITTTTSSLPVENDGEREKERRGGRHERGGRRERGEREEKEGRIGGRRRDENNNNNNGEENEYRRGGHRGGRRGGRRGRDVEEGQTAPVPVDQQMVEGVKEERGGKEEWKQRNREMKEAVRAMKETGDKQALKELRAKVREDRKRFKTEHPAREGEEKKRYKKRRDLKMKILNEVPLQPASPLLPNSVATKTWHIKNVGQVEWPAGSQLLFMSRRGETGPTGLLQNGGKAVEAGSEVDLSVTFTASNEAGSYFAKYSLVTPDGEAFGKKLAVFFAVAPEREDNNVDMQ